MTANDFSQFDRICTLGPKGTFSYQAANIIGGDLITDIQYATTIPQIADEVAKNHRVLGVMPIENSTSGVVGPAQDALVEADVVIVNELRIDVRYSMISHVPLEKVERFFCHSVAFNQTMVFTAQYLPKAEVVFANSNIHSGELFLERKGEPIAAIIPAPAAHETPEYRDKIVHDNVQDYENNITRFVVLQKRPENYQPDFSKAKTSMFVVFDEDRHSLLFELLREFHVFGVNLSRLESRPAKNTPWSYSFFIDLDNNHRVTACLEALEALKIDFQVFGSYDIITPE